MHTNSRMKWFQNLQELVANKWQLHSVICEDLPVVQLSSTTYENPVTRHRDIGSAPVPAKVWTLILNIS